MHFFGASYGHPETSVNIKGHHTLNFSVIQMIKVWSAVECLDLQSHP